MEGILYKELFPDRSLTDFVKCFWWAENLTDITHEFTILPDGCFGMVVQFHDNKLQTIFLKGIWTKPFEIIIPPKSSFYAVRFKPLAVESVLFFNISEIVDQNVELDKSFCGINKLPFKDINEFSDLLTTKMSAAFTANKKFDERKQRLFNLLFETKGAISVDEIAKILFWSSRQLNRYFKKVFGLSLKSYCNILKVYSSYPQIAKGEFYPQQDYYDQAHFIKNVRQYTRANPKKLYQNKKDRFIQLSIIDEK
jgi:AraC-like DNA-binding protein